MSWIVSICLGIALSAACGFRVFIPLLAASLASHWGIVPLTANLAWMGSWAATACFATAAVIEVAAYYIPFVDNLLDTITTPLSLAAGTMLSASMLTGTNDPLIQWGLGAVVGGGSAGVVQAGTSFIRAKVSAFTGGTGNAAFSTAENGLAATLSVVAIAIPLVTAAAVCALFYFIIKKIFSKNKKRNEKNI